MPGGSEWHSSDDMGESESEAMQEREERSNEESRSKNAYPREHEGKACRHVRNTKHRPLAAIRDIRCET